LKKLPRFSGKLKRLRNSLLIRRVVGNSMLPTFAPGKVVFASSWLRPSVGRVVIIDHNGHEKIKRIRSVDGDGWAFVVGDNAAESTDSRQFGAVPSDSIVAIVLSRK
jgi:phage repressor protein C with HTH and peptisase S24 domain